MQRAAGQIQRLPAQGQCRRAVDITAAVQAGSQRATVVQLYGAGADIAVCGQQAAVVQGLTGVDRQCAAAVQRAALIQFAAGKPRIALAAEAASQFQPAVVAQDKTAGTGSNLTGVAHADTGFGADQEDLAGIHAAKPGGIQRESGFVASGRTGAGGRGFSVGGDLILAGDHAQVLRPQPGIDFDCAGKDGGMAGLRCIQPGTVDANQPVLDLKTAQSATGAIQRPAGAQRGAIGIDEAATGTADAGRVGDDHLGTITGDFDKAAQLAWLVAVDLVDDDLRRALAQPRIALHPAPLAGAGIGAGIVEDHATRIDVELLVAIARHPGCARGLDIDLRQSVGGVDDGRLLVFGGARVGNNGGGPAGTGQAQAQQQGGHGSSGRSERHGV